MNFYFRKFRYSPNWHVYADSHDIGSVGQYWVDGKRRGFEATVRVIKEDGRVGGFKTIGTGYINRTEAAKALWTHPSNEDLFNASPDFDIRKAGI